VLHLAKAGFNVKLVSQNDERMAKIVEQVKEINPDIKTEIVKLDVSDSSPQDYAALFTPDQRTSIVVNNAGIMKNQKLF
jgi:short-subunit dehydrogenase